MHSFSAVFISALLATASGSPILIARGDTCGVAPSASNTKNQPLSQPSNINTANDCKSQCDAKSGCQSFCFGLVDNAVQCKLFSCDASAIPKQDSANLVAYNKGCSSIPSVVPTKVNPTGKVVEGDKKQSPSNDKLQVVDTKQKSTQGNKDEPQASQVKHAQATPTPAKAQQPKASPSPAKAQQPKASPSPAKAQQPKASPSPVKPAASKATPAGQQQKQTTDNQEKQTSNNQQKQTTTEAKTCGSKPAGTTSNEPISKPTVASVDACKSKCEAESKCKSFTCGTVNNAFQCQLYNVEASNIPAPTTTAQKSAFTAYDVGCSM